MKKLLLFLSLAIPAFQLLTGQNNPPEAVHDSVNGVSQVPIIIDVLANDYDLDGDSIFITNVISHVGEAYIVDGKIWCKPLFSRNNGIQYFINDGTHFDFAYVDVIVSVNPNAPVSVEDTFEVVELAPQTLDVLSNDYDPNNDNIRINRVSDFTDCYVEISDDSLSVIVIPEKTQYAGFWYNVIERGGDSLVSYGSFVRLYVHHNPDLPEAVEDTAFTTGGISVDIPFLDNDYDPQGEEFELNHFGQPYYGTVNLNGDTFTYNPEFSIAGVDRFYYSLREVNDTTIISDSIAVTIYVNKNPNCPVAVEDTASGMSATPIIIDVLPNDYDINGDEIRVHIVNYPGTVTPDNKISYTSPSYVTDYDSISYNIVEVNNPASYSEPARVSIKLQPNPAYPWGVNDTVTTYAGTAIDVYPVANDIKNGHDSLVLFRIMTNNLNLDQLKVEKSGNKVIITPPYQTSGQFKFNYFVTPLNSGFSSAGRGIVVVNVLPTNFTDSLTVNNINAAVSANGDLFSYSYVFPDENNPYYVKPQFEVPLGGGVSTIFQNRLLIGGIDGIDKLFVTANTSEWKQGPVSEMYDSSLYKFRYSRVWKVTKDEIEYHRHNYQTPNYQPVKSIFEWPGNGFHTKGESLHLAPFFDVNADDNYQPEQGDYPLIRGDECIFFMCNDDMERLHDSTASPLKVEVHGMVYGFNNPSDTALFNTVFVHYDIINRSSTTYNNCYASLWTDYDIGNATDDYYKTDVTRSSIIVYNSDDDDELYNGTGYGDNPAAQSITVLAGPFIDPDNIDNPAGGCDFSVNGLNFENTVIDDERHGLSRAIQFRTYDEDFWGIDPLTNSELYDYMLGFWDDETPILYGGNGHQTNGATGPQARYMFPGNSDPLNFGTNCDFPSNGYNQGDKFWTEEEVGNEGSDQFGLGTMGPFTLAPGNVQEIELAYCTGLGNNGAMSSVHQLLRNIDSLRAAVAQGKIIVPNGSLGLRPDFRPDNIQIYPNPASDVIVISNMDENGGAEFNIYNFWGNVVAKGILTGTRPIINVNHLTPGLYIVKLSNGRTISTGKFIKM